MPTNTAMFAIRIGVVPQDQEDLLNVNALQEEFHLTSLSNWGNAGKFGDAAVPDLGERPNDRARPGPTRPPIFSPRTLHQRTMRPR